MTKGPQKQSFRSVKESLFVIICGIPAKRAGALSALSVILIRMHLCKGCNTDLFVQSNPRGFPVR